MKGGIPVGDIEALKRYWAVFPSLQDRLFSSAPPVPHIAHATLHPPYFETHFVAVDARGDWPAAFAVITACSPTGDTRSAAENEEADRRLEAELRQRGSWMKRVTGYSPTTGHKEPGWAAALSFDAACDLGVQLRQDAIYYIDGGTLYVSHCDQRRTRVPVGDFQARLRGSVVRSAARPGFVDLAVEKSAIKSAIYEHPEFTAFIAEMNAHFAAWRKECGKTLKALKAGCHPKAIIIERSESLLEQYVGKPLIDPYDIYQHLMDYWGQTMQDDCYLIAADGWKAESYRIIEKDKKGKEKDKGWACDLVPKPLIVARYDAKEQADIDQLAGEVESATAKLSDLEEEHGGEEGAFSELDKVNKPNVGW